MDWIHLHLALNHIPVLGTPFLLCFLLWSWQKGQSATIRFCVEMFAMLALASIAIKFTGDFAAEQIPPSPEFEKRLIDRHEQSADQATTGVFVMGVAAVVSLLLSRGGRPLPKWSLPLIAALALATCLLMARTAQLGGHIRHPEIRPSNPVLDQNNR